MFKSFPTLRGFTLCLDTLRKSVQLSKSNSKIKCFWKCKLKSTYKISGRFATWLERLQLHLWMWSVLRGDSETQMKSFHWSNFITIHLIMIRVSFWNWFKLWGVQVSFKTWLILRAFLSAKNAKIGTEMNTTLVCLYSKWNLVNRNNSNMFNKLCLRFLNIWKTELFWSKSRSADKMQKLPLRTYFYLESIEDFFEVLSLSVETMRIAIDTVELNWKSVLVWAT